MIHPQAIVEDGAHLGAGTRIWAFAHILGGARVGMDCNICDGVFIENDVVVGNRVTVKCGVQLWDGVRLEDDVFVGPNATFTNDLYPRSQVERDHLETIVRRGASIGANATILPGIEIGEGAMVGAGTVVTRDVSPGTTVVGSPARVLLRRAPCVVHLTQVLDDRGNLAVLDHVDLPFEPKRTFLVYDVPDRSVRGEHAHKECHQFLVCVAGSVTVDVSGATSMTTPLWVPNRGLYVPPMHWVGLSDFSEDAVLLVLASHPYDPDDYIRDYEDFKEMCAMNQESATG